MLKAVSEYIEDMLQHKESLGYSRKSYEYDLEQFNRYAQAEHLDVSGVTEDVILKWCSRRDSESSTGQRRRVQSLRELLKYLSAVGVDCYVIPSSFVPRQEVRTPYIFSDKELQDIFRECDKLSLAPCSPHRHLILPVLLRLIFFCGLRPNEGRELQVCDIDFDKGVLLVRKNKAHKERYVAFSDNVAQTCVSYYTKISPLYPNCKYFFPSPDGIPYDHHWLAKQFRTIWKRSRVKDNQADAVVYDLRHRYATTMMMKWLNEGADLYAKLPYLSAYMGHTNFSDTAYYIHLLPENLIRSSAIDWDHFSDLIPEVIEGE